MRVSVIIPTLNEEAHLPRCLVAVRAELPDAEVIVVDGGSTDATRALARAHDVTLVTTGRGRGRQCRAGGEAATGEVLFFLHADCVLADGAGAAIHAYFSQPSHRAATFRVRYPTTRWMYRFLAWGSRFDNLWASAGDQGMLMRRGLYDAVDGVPAWPLFEDLELLRRLRSRTRIASLTPALHVSIRRFEPRGVYRQIAHNIWLTVQWRLGVAPEMLAKRYRPEQKTSLIEASDRQPVDRLA